MSHLRLLGHSLWVTVAVCLLALAIAFTGTRVLLSYAADYRVEVEQRISEQLGVPVKIGALRGAVRGFRPELRLLDVRVVKADGADEPLQMREIRLGIDPFKLLGQGQFWPDYVSLVGTRLLIERHVDGHISVAGMRASTKQETSVASTHSLAWLLSEGTFEVVDSDILWWDHARDRTPISLSKTNVRIENGYLEHRVAIRAALPVEIGKTFELRLHLQGDLLASAGWGGHAWFQGEDVDVAALADRLPMGKWQIDQGVANIQLWSTWERSKLVSVGGQAALNQPHIQHSGGKHEVALDRLDADFLWQAEGQGWRLHVNDLLLTAAGIQQSEGRFSLGVQQAESEEAQWVLASDAWEFDALAFLALQSGLLEADLQQGVQQMEPSGTLSELQLFWSKSEARPKWALCAGLDAVSAKASETWPGGKQISGQLCAGPQAGWLSLDSQGAEIELPKLFREPLPVDRLYGDLRWSRQPEHWLLHSDSLLVDSPDIQTLTRLTLKFPLTGGKPWMDIQSDFKDADAAQVRRYLPAGIMGPKTLAWLDQAFLAGQVPEGQFVYRGEASGFPFRDDTGLFQVLFEAKGVTLSLAEGWPNLLGVEGTVDFKNQGLTITGRQGEISGNRIKSALVTIPDLQHSKRIQVTGEIEDDVAGLYRFFRESPLSKAMGGLLSASEIKGPGRIWLDLGIPLRSGVEPIVKAKASVKDGEMKFPDWQLSVSRVTGDIEFDKQGLQAKSLQGEWLGRPVQTQIRSDAQQTRVIAQGHWPITTLARAYPSPAWEWLTGTTDAALTVRVPKSVLEGRGQVGFELASDLKGVAVDLPAPVGKSKAQTVPLEVQVTLGDPKTLPLRWSYGKRVQGLAEFKPQAKSSAYALDRADIHFGATAAARPSRPGIRLSGQIGTLDVDQWRRLQDKASAQDSQSTLLVNQVELAVDSLIWSGQSFSNVAFQGVREARAWEGRMTGPLLQGRIRLPEQPSNQDPVNLQLEHLHWPGDDSAEEGQTEEQNAAESASFDPQSIPPIQLTSEQFSFADARLGRLLLTTQRSDDGLVIKALDIESKRDHLQASGAWTLRQGQPKTTINGTLKSQALGDLLDDLGFTSQLKQTESDIGYRLNWSAAPYAYDNALLNGDIRLKTGKGRLLDLEPGVGRVFGLLSLGTIQRRLQLDFSDLLQKGMSFDKIKASYRIRDGHATTDDFKLEGPAAKLEISGRIGLADRDYDQLVIVTPKTTASLPVAGAIAGGPVVGAAVFLAQKLLGKDVDKITRIQYQVTGSWDDPDIKQIRAPARSLMDKVFKQPAIEESKHFP